MAKVHGISGSTRYLLKGTKSINGKKLTTLNEIKHFYNHYEEILAKTELTIQQQQDKIISDLSNEEARLNQKIQEGIARRTFEVDTDIIEINNKIETTGNLLWKTGYKLKYWIYTSLRSYRIKCLFVGAMWELRILRNRKERTIANKPSVIAYECQKVVDSHKFLTNNKSFLIGARGEERVISTLSQLSDDYHVLNDVNLRFSRAFRWREMNEYIRTSQIDHVVIGPTGIFLLETKNWKASDIEIKSDDLIYQVRRKNLALWYYLKDYYIFGKTPRVRTVVVSTQGSRSGKKLDKYIDIMSPSQLCEYIARREITRLTLK